jgi:sterol desaturase/sphingolipid hydroxylase (fatty acid hydroxylase superfamily)
VIAAGPAPGFEHLRGYASVLWLVVLLGWESIAPYFALFRDGWRHRGGHALRNIVMGALNALLIRLLFVGGWKWMADRAEASGFGLLNLTPLPGWIHVLGAVVLLDFWTYWWHRANHRLPFLWRFHRTHHSDPEMDVTTANRFHLGEILFSSCLRLAVIPLLGVHFWEVAVYETLLQFVVQLHHANVGLPVALDRFLRLFIVTPLMHKVHHSRIQSETDSNYSSLMPVWDRLFGSFRLRADPRAIQFGLHGYDAAEKQSLAGLLKTPLGR